MTKSVAVVISLCVVYCVAVKGFELSTPDSVVYKFFPYSHKSVHFKVKAASDLHVALTTGPEEVDPMVEIIIGGWANTNSVLQRRFRTVQIKNSAETPHITSAGEYRGFWVSWDGGVISVGRENDDAPFLSWKDPEPFNVTHIGVHTGFGSKGSWIFEDSPPAPVRIPSSPSTTNDVENLCRKISYHYCSLIHLHGSLTQF